jgi:lipopolysaccharide/colanic/teichoic acid biosynthesis glycosyltransferase
LGLARRETPIFADWRGLVVKRSIDLLLAGLLLAFFLPLLAGAAIAVKLDSEGPALFRQVRVGRRFKRFQLLKLRTMQVASEGPIIALGEDPRITRIGGWLRRLKLDELPQLWNVLRGEMSLVGPRPVIPELTEEFQEAYELLLVARPGLTDPATLKYRRESEILAQVPKPMEFFKTVVVPDKLRLSLAYLEAAGFCSDLRVILRTAAALLPRLWGRDKPISVPPAGIAAVRRLGKTRSRSARVLPRSTMQDAFRI